MNSDVVIGGCPQPSPFLPTSSPPPPPLMHFLFTFLARVSVFDSAELTLFWLLFFRVDRLLPLALTLSSPLPLSHFSPIIFPSFLFFRHHHQCLTAWKRWTPLTISLCRSFDWMEIGTGHPEMLQKNMKRKNGPVKFLQLPGGKGGMGRKEKSIDDEFLSFCATSHRVHAILFFIFRTKSLQLILHGTIPCARVVGVWYWYWRWSGCCVCCSCSCCCYCCLWLRVFAEISRFLPTYLTNLIRFSFSFWPFWFARSLCALNLVMQHSTTACMMHPCLCGHPGYLHPCLPYVFLFFYFLLFPLFLTLNCRAFMLPIGTLCDHCHSEKDKWHGRGMVQGF